ncbi:MAG TPA: hypothetical protein DEP42_03290, partial [Ruminococcaceae bacterium]|nr:hypothetical protein [Oscillospiraceae bacterium]
MELPIMRDTISINTPFLDTTVDHPVDCDIVLPDYCPDVSRVLRTESCAEIDAKQIDGARLTVSGTLYIHVLYITENSCSIRCLTHETAFSHTFDLKEECTTDAYAYVSARVIRANCRLIGPRRVQVRGSIVLHARVFCEMNESFVSDIDDERLEINHHSIQCSTPVAFVEKPFQVHEQLEINYGKPAASSIIKSDATVFVQDFKLISNKVIIKADLKLKTLYSSEAEEEDSGIEVVEHNLPISQIVDISGVDEECGCILNLHSGNVKASISQNSEGENRQLDVQLDVMATANVYRTREITVVTDAFSPKFETMIQTSPVHMQYVSDTVHKTEVLQESLELENAELKTVIDCTTEAYVKESKFENGVLAMAGDLYISGYALNSQGGPVSFDKTVPFSMKEPVEGAPNHWHANPEIRIV